MRRPAGSGGGIAVIRRSDANSSASEACTSKLPRPRHQTAEMFRAPPPPYHFSKRLSRFRRGQAETSLLALLLLLAFVFFESKPFIEQARLEIRTKSVGVDAPSSQPPQEADSGRLKLVYPIWWAAPFETTTSGELA